MIKPLTISNHTYPVNLIQGPLAGVSCAPFRLLTWRHSHPAFTCTEMISCKTLIHQPILAQQRFIKIAPNEGPVCFQLSSTEPYELAEAVKRVTDYGASLIDLNCGCPVKKIRSKGAGSKLLSDPNLLYQLITAMKQNTSLPISIKIRVDAAQEKLNHDVAKAVTDAGADFLIVHGRHWSERYDTPCRYDEIQFFVEHCHIPVIGNGDIACVSSLKNMLATGCSGVMIARAGVGQPWLIKQLMTEYAGEIFTPPTQKEIGEIFLEHVTRLITLLNSEKFAILQARKFGKYYGRPLQNRAAFTEKLNQCESLSTLNQIIKDHFI